MLIASMNPCPCGYYNHPEKECVCPPGSVQRYLNKISGPLLDRIDLHVEVTPVSFEKIANQQRNESSESIRERVIKAREIQTERFKNQENIFSNSMMPSPMVSDICQINEAGKKSVENSHGAIGNFRPGPTTGS
jgi:magnesium chelatase family protein